MRSEHAILPDASRYTVTSLRWERTAHEPFLELRLRHRDTSDVRRLRFLSPTNVHVDQLVDELKMAIAEVHAMERVGVEVYGLGGSGGLRVLARDVVDVTAPSPSPVSVGEQVTPIRVAELRRVANLVFDRLEAGGDGAVELVADHYWSIPSERMFHPEPPAEPSLEVGQLTSDLEELSEVGRGQDPIPSHDLAHLAAVLRYVASRVG